MRYVNVFDEMNLLKRDLDRIFGDWNTWDFPFSRISFLPGIAARQYPMINLSEDGDHYDIKALAPGLDPKKIEVTVTGNTLTISGEKVSTCDAVDQDDYHRCERAAGKFIRTLELPSFVDDKKVSATYTDGILSISLPKAESAKPKYIAIKEG
ncbi:Hsp20/alpha crystallin family protein [bacterium]|nr:Hsp20/alpha crystallin family protein [candidate division CSSED10-310 bacterium]